MKKLNSKTISCYVNPIMGIYAFIGLCVLGKDTYQFIGDIICNHVIVLVIFVMMAGGLIM